jgi:hypothetical protein
LKGGLPGQPRKAEELLPGLFKSLGLDLGADFLEVAAAFDRALASVLGRPKDAELPVRVSGLRRGDLTVEVDSSALLGELQTFYSDQLLETLRAELPPDQAKARPIRRIRYRLKGMGHV